MRELLLESIEAAEKRVPNEALEIIQYMACDAMPFLETAVGDSDPAVRRSAIYTASVMVFAVQHGYNRKLTTLSHEAGSAHGAVDDECDADRVMAQFVKMATAALTDPDGGVRSMAIDQLASKPVKAALPAIQKMAKDPDARVRAAVQKSLYTFGIRDGLIEAAADSLDDQDIGVRKQAMETLRKSAEPPSMAILDRAFQQASPDVGMALIELMYEQEDQNLSSRLLAGFKERSSQERLAILTAIAGHNDDAALKLAAMGASDKDGAVRRAALMRLLQFPAEKVALALRSSGGEGAPELKGLARAVRAEAERRELFPFLASGAGSAREAEFPSQNGTQPMVSPDGRWIAYVETGWGRPGGTGGTGRSNLLSLVHAVRAEGTNDRILSDMFLVGWLADSARIASSRDAFAAVVDLNGSISAEFGEVMKKPYTGTGPFGGQAWPSGELRSQGGVDMPHSKRIGGDIPPFFGGEEVVAFFSRDEGEDAAFSPDGRWLGPLVDKDTASFIDSEGHKIDMKLPQLTGIWGHRATWSPDGRYILINGVHKSNSGPNQSMVEPVKALIIEFALRSVRVIEDVDEVPWVGDWDYRKGRWNPWARDSAHTAFVRRGQVWVSDASGANQRQVTFDSSNKVFPTFSPDGNRLAYITLQNDERKHYRRSGPTDLWVVDVATTIAARLTAPAPGRIDSLDWLDNFTLVFDRVDPDGLMSIGKPISMLKTISLQ
jgi:HEAT repeat protein